MPLKLIGGVLLALVGLSAGCLMTRSLEKRCRLYRSLIVFVSLLTTGIQCNGADIRSAVNFSAQEAGLTPLCVEDGLPFEQGWQTALMKLGLKPDDHRLLTEFGSQLGKTDLDGQLRHLALFDSLFRKRLGECEEELNTKARLYRALGVFAGTGAALIII